MSKKLKCPDNELGEPKKKFSETFSGIKMLVEHFAFRNPPLNNDTTHGGDT